MTVCSLRSTIWLHQNLLTHAQPTVAPRRGISTTAAIKKGLKSESGSKGGRHRDVRQDTESLRWNSKTVQNEGRISRNYTDRGGDLSTAKRISFSRLDDPVSTPPRKYITRHRSDDRAYIGKPMSVPSSMLSDLKGRQLRRVRTATGQNFLVLQRKIKQLSTLLKERDDRAQKKENTYHLDDDIKNRLDVISAELTPEKREFVDTKLKEVQLNTPERWEEGSSVVQFSGGRYLISKKGVSGTISPPHGSLGFASEQESRLPASNAAQSITQDSARDSETLADPPPRLRASLDWIVNGTTHRPSTIVSALDRDSQTTTATSPNNRERTRDSADGSADTHPISIPYTTAASTFLYGYNAVLAALRAKRRKLHVMYLHHRTLQTSDGNSNELERLAQEAGVRIKGSQVAGGARIERLRLMDAMSEGRPHNGVVLEASRLPVPPVLALGRPDLRKSTIPLRLDQQSVEDFAVNGAPLALPTLPNSWRHPLVLLLDGILDPQNVGSILRTAHFYGVDAVAVAVNTCVNLSSAALAKAASGAAEAVTLLALPKPSNFVYDSARNGWHIYAAVAPDPAADAEFAHLNRTQGLRHISKQVSISAIAEKSPLAKYPCILMLGAEGEGLRANLRTKADVEVTIEQGQRERSVPDVGVDSINVGVAAGILLEAFVRKPEGAAPKKSVLGW